MEVIHQHRILSGLAIGEVIAHDIAKRAGHWDGGKVVDVAVAGLEVKLLEILGSAIPLKNLPSANIVDHNALEEKLADLIILVMDISGAYHLDVPSAVVSKLLYNEAKSKLGKDAKL